MRRAFSLIELSIVILIIGILIAGVTQGTRLVREMQLATARTQTNSAPVLSINDILMWVETTSTASFIDTEASDGATVSNWYDINQGSVTKNNPTQASSGNRPTYILSCMNSLPCLRFDGAHSYFTFDGTVLAGTDFTVIVVERRRSNVANNYFIGGTNEAQNSLLVLGYRDDTHITFAQYLNDIDIVVPAYSSPTPKIHVFTHSSKVGKNYYSNGVQMMTNSGATTGLSSFINARIGYYGNFPPVLFNGDLVEIIMFRKALKNEERRSIESYLGKKWNIKVS